MKNMQKMMLNALRLTAVGERKDTGFVAIEGYACHFGEPNHNGEIVDESSFRDWFREMRQGGVMPVFNYQHGQQIIGGWDKFEADAVGLKALGHLNTNVVEVRDNILPLVQSGDVTHLSTEGWCDWEQIEERENGLYLRKFMLCGVSLVSLPADFAAKAELKNAFSEWRAKNDRQTKKLYY